MAFSRLSPAHLLVKKKKSHSGHGPQTYHAYIEHRVCEHVGMAGLCSKGSFVSEAVYLKIHTEFSPPPEWRRNRVALSFGSFLEYPVGTRRKSWNNWSKPIVYWFMPTNSLIIQHKNIHYSRTPQSSIKRPHFCWKYPSLLLSCLPLLSQPMIF